MIELILQIVSTVTIGLILTGAVALIAWDSRWDDYEQWDE